jgi:ABC-type dipeptide/oligopeptide/nickel transport system permease component
MLSETQFGKWMTLALRFGFGHRSDGPSIGRELLGAGAITLLLIAATTVGSWLATLLPWSFLSRARNPQRRSGYEYVGQTIASVPAITLVVLFACVVGPNRSWSNATITALSVALLVAIANHLATSGAGGVELIRTQVELDRRSQSPILRLLRQWPLAGHRWPYTLLLVFVVERAVGVHAMADLTVAAFRRRDLHSLMAITTMTASWLLLVEFVVQSRRSLPSLRRTRTLAPKATST